jgi:hypothetical protein
VAELERLERLGVQEKVIPPGDIRGDRRCEVHEAGEPAVRAATLGSGSAWRTALSG